MTEIIHPPKSAISGFDGEKFQYFVADPKGHLISRNEVWNPSTLAWEAMTQPVVNTDTLTVSGSMSISNWPASQPVEVEENNTIVTLYMSGTATYVCEAVPGTALATAAWKVFKYDSATGKGAYADGNANYDNAATDLATVAAYSYS